MELKKTEIIEDEKVIGVHTIVSAKTFIYGLSNREEGSNSKKE